MLPIELECFREAVRRDEEKAALRGLQSPLFRGLKKTTGNTAAAPMCVNGDLADVPSPASLRYEFS